MGRAGPGAGGPVFSLPHRSLQFPGQPSCKMAAGLSSENLWLRDVQSVWRDSFYLGMPPSKVRSAGLGLAEGALRVVKGRQRPCALR